MLAIKRSAGVAPGESQGIYIKVTSAEVNTFSGILALNSHLQKKLIKSQ